MAFLTHRPNYDSTSSRTDDAVSHLLDEKDFHPSSKLQRFTKPKLIEDKITSKLAFVIIIVDKNDG